MQKFKLGHANDSDWQTAVTNALAQTGTPEEANLGFIYVTDHFTDELGNILQTLKRSTHIAHWVGSVGQAILCSGIEYYDQPALVILLAEFPDASFNVFTQAENAPPQQNGAVDGLRFAIVHGDPRNGQLPQIISQFPEQLGNGYLSGGLTSSASQFYQIADDIVEGQLSGVVFNDQVPVITGLSQGCSPIGPPHTLTSCDHHMAISIDHRPAMDVFKQDIGEVLARNIDRAAGYIFAGFPVTDSDTGDYLVRTIVGIDPEHGRLAIGDHMTEGAPIIFCRRDANSARDDMQRMLSDVKQRLKGATPRGGIYISCLGRGRNLFGENSEEMQMISEALGDVPLIGFYANGEIAGHRLYSYTGTLTLFL